jgi:hypothetical protein
MRVFLKRLFNFDCLESNSWVKKILKEHVLKAQSKPTALNGRGECGLLTLNQLGSGVTSNHCVQLSFDIDS